MTATIDQQFLEYIVKTLVNKPDAVAVERIIDEKGVLLSLTVDPEDVGRVIGKRGVTAQSIRTLLRALGTKNDARYNLKIVNTDNYEGHKDAKKAEKSAQSSSDNAEESAYASSETTEVEEEKSELAEKTRAELADLDDLEI